MQATTKTSKTRKSDCGMKDDPHEKAAKACLQAEKAVAAFADAVLATPEGKAQATSVAMKRYAIEQKLVALLYEAGITRPKGEGS